MASERRLQSPRYGRCFSGRRIFEIQGLTNQEIQAIEELFAAILKALDSYRNSGPEWDNGLIRSSLHLGFRSEFGTVYHTLPEGILRSIALRQIRMDAKARRIRKSNRSNKPSSSAAKRRRLPGYAEADELENSGFPPGFYKVDL